MKDALIAVAVAVCGFIGTVVYLRESPTPPTSPTVASAVVATRSSGAAQIRQYPAEPPQPSGAQHRADEHVAPVNVHPVQPQGESRGETPAQAPPAAVEATATPSAPLPVAVKFRRLPGNEFQAGVVNTSPQTLPLEVLITNSAGKQITQQLQAAPGSGVSLSAAQGWQLESGDQVTLRAAGYQDLIAQVP